jgi:hypothetical protein
MSTRYPRATGSRPRSTAGEMTKTRRAVRVQAKDHDKVKKPKGRCCLDAPCAAVVRSFATRAPQSQQNDRKLLRAACTFPDEELLWLDAVATTVSLREATRCSPSRRLRRLRRQRDVLGLPGIADQTPSLRAIRGPRCAIPGLRFGVPGTPRPVRPKRRHANRAAGRRSTFRGFPCMRPLATQPARPRPSPRALPPSPPWISHRPRRAMPKLSISPRQVGPLADRRRPLQSAAIVRSLGA